ncbi:MAG TPA: hypothetical protein VE093_38350 [Polyangiaceae bacterium]|jgi:hypothetical protein|nr:hypothetical protein [Polyangiaceae bacterium]
MRLALSGPFLLVLMASLAGCASSQPVLQDPVLTRCSEGGLRACDELTDGIVLYADGELDTARAKLWRAGSLNSPDELKKFSASIQELGTSPRAETYSEPLIEVASLLAMQADRAAQAAPKRPPPPPAPPPAPKPQAEGPPKPPRRENGAWITAETDPTRLDGGLAAPGTSPAKVPCGGLFGSGAAYCIKATEGPFVVTDIKVVPGCPNELFVAAGSSTSPRWALLSTAGSPLSVHGGRLVVKPGEFLFVGAQAPKIEKVSTDARCAVVWGGFRPYTSAADAGAIPRDLGF